MRHELLLDIMWNHTELELEPKMVWICEWMLCRDYIVLDSEAYLPKGIHTLGPYFTSGFSSLCKSVVAHARL